MKIYTKSGDKGKTSLVGGTRVSKTHVRIKAYGTVDELNSWLGVLRDQAACIEYREEIKKIQERLFTIGSNLALEEKGKFEIPELSEGDIVFLENLIDSMEEGLPPMRNFVLPGGHQAVSFCHVCRTVCRRAERKVVEMDENLKVDQIIVKYLNRLSDLLFVLSRRIAFDQGVQETPWIPKKS
ncbi:MAG: cob(I)yrinic acid a,c-diamide adenosyltransferase [Flavobacteriales bacterium]|nr:cob(I)yrinic acid a,c-diamide adenosyltransferase [Flavobacteriales bacterium]